MHCGGWQAHPFVLGSGELLSRPDAAVHGKFVNPGPHACPSRFNRERTSCGFMTSRRCETRRSLRTLSTREGEACRRPTLEARATARFRNEELAGSNIQSAFSHPSGIHSRPLQKSTWCYATETEALLTDQHASHPSPKKNQRGRPSPWPQSSVAVSSGHAWAFHMPK